MRIEVVGRGVEITDAIRAYATSKVEHLGRHFDGVSSVTVAVARADHSHKATYDVEVLTAVPRHDPFVCHAKSEDLYGAIDMASQKADRQVTEFKDRLREGR